MDNYMKLEIAAISKNEGFARSAVAAFALELNPSLTELSDILGVAREARKIAKSYIGANS